MHIGIDFGTTYTKIAIFREAGGFKLFRFPGPRGKEYIPTAVAYRRSEEGKLELAAIGEAAVNDYLRQPGTISLVHGFKLFLPLQDPEER